MPKLLGAPELVGSTARQEGWSAFHRLFASLLRFLAPFLRTAELRDTSRSLYRGTLRILLVLLHDFPEFLCNYHHSLCDIIPPSCIQLRNLVLSAFPSRQHRLPDPFTPNLKIDRLPEISQAPVILSDYVSALEQPQQAPLFAGAQPSGGSGGSPAFKAALDAYLRDRAPASFLTSLKDAVVSPANAAREIDYARGESRYDVTFINALVLYVGIAAIQRDGLLNGNAQVDVGIDVFQQLLDDLDAEGEPSAWRLHRSRIFAHSTSHRSLPAAHGCGEPAAIPQQPLGVL
jgi:CCR4-NOT transcription complex subunit 1